VDLSSLRQELEWVWSDDTAYQARDDSAAGPSAGQCGVTSALLAKHFDREGLDVEFCEGSVHFDDHGLHDIESHCWVELPPTSTNAARLNIATLIVDLTADQAGPTADSVIFEPAPSLEGRGIHYEAKARRSVSFVDAKQSLRQRLDELMRRMDVLATPEKDSATPSDGDG